MDRASQYLPEKFTSLPSTSYPHGQEHRPRQDLLECVDSVCEYLNILEKEEEEDRKADIESSAFTVEEEEENE